MLIYANPYVCLCLVVGINSRINTSVWCLPLFSHFFEGSSFRQVPILRGGLEPSTRYALKQPGKNDCHSQSSWGHPIKVCAKSIDTLCKILKYLT